MALNNALNHTAIQARLDLHLVLVGLVFTEHSLPVFLIIWRLLAETVNTELLIALNTFMFQTQNQQQQLY